MMRTDTDKSASSPVFPIATDAEDKISLREDEGDRDREECEQKEDENSPTRKGGDERRPLVPAKEKVGEGRDNLRRREEWYQKRSGKRPS